MRRTALLIVGAGPYGLAVAACAKERGMDAVLTGCSMEFWQQHMPAGMLLRSPLDWHMDPFARRTLVAFLQDRKLNPSDVGPLPVELFCEYARWFAEGYALESEADRIATLRREDGWFVAETEGGDRVEARNVILAPGAAPFVHIPADLAAMLPPNSFSHTCDTVSFEGFRGRSCLIIGGRQSAYEWAVLMAEAGAADVHISHRHATPEFEESDWSWVAGMIDATEREAGWFRRLPATEREDIRQRFYAEGRLKLEPWLPPRLDRQSIHLHPGTQLAGAALNATGALDVRLDDGSTFAVDHVLFATGYRVEMSGLPLLSDDTIGPEVALSGGYPVLDECFQTSLPGLFIAGLASTEDFGPFFGFVAGCPVTARMLVGAVAQREQGG
jgi:thioredoxin reductase